MKAILIALSAIVTTTSARAISITTLGSAVTEDFNTLASSGTSSTMPTGWFFSESGANANTTYAAGSGSSSTGNTYSFGAVTSTDRALGGLLSGSLTPTFGVSIANSTQVTINSLAISFTGEQWRLGTESRPDRLDFQYSLDATSLGNGTWTDIDALDFIAPTTTGSAGALDGNGAANRTSLSATLSGISIVNGGALWFRWRDFDASGADDGLAIDDFSVVARSASQPPLKPIPDSGSTALLLVIPFLGLLVIQRRRTQLV